MELIRVKDLWTNKFFENAGWTQDEDGAWTGGVFNLYKLYGVNTDGFFGANMNITQPVVMSFTAKYDYVNETYASGMNLRFQYTDGTASVVIVNTTTYSDYKLVSKAGKVIDKICCSFGTGSNITYFKDVKIQVLGEFNEVVDKPKNLIPFPYHYMTVSRPSVNGITLTTSDNGYITANGSATKTTTFSLANGSFKVPKKVRLQGFFSSKRTGVAIQFYNDTTLILGRAIYGTDFVDIDTPDTSTYNRINVYLIFLADEPLTDASANAVLSEVGEITEWSPPSQPQPYSPYIIRNLIQLNRASDIDKTVNGITAKLNADDCTITYSGAKIDVSQPGLSSVVAKRITLKAGKYYFSGCPKGGSTSTYYQVIRINTSADTYVAGVDIGNGAIVKIDRDLPIDYVNVRIADLGGAESVVFKPLLIKLPEEV